MVMNEITIFESEEGTQVEVRFDGETVWATQRQISKLLETTPQNTTLHLKNAGNLIFKSLEFGSQNTTLHLKNVYVE